MNTISKAVIAVLLLLSAVAFGRWEKVEDMEEVGRASKACAVSVTTSADGKIVYYAQTGRLFKSTDGGETWVVLK